MKLLMGFIILLVALVAVTGCTQPASSSVQTTTQTPAPTTVVTTVATSVPTTVATTVPVTNVTMVANVTTAPAANVTAVVTTVATAATPTSASEVTTVHITSTGFTPLVDSVLPGTGITFVNNDNVSHSIMTIGNYSGVFNSGAIVPTGGFTYTFTVQQTGTIVYQLDKSNITGTIIVQANPNSASY